MAKFEEPTTIPDANLRRLDLQKEIDDLKSKIGEGHPKLAAHLPRKYAESAFLKSWIAEKNRAMNRASSWALLTRAAKLIRNPDTTNEQRDELLHDIEEHVPEEYRK